jgi:HSP20 family molecular chaperone IbpA
MEGEQRSASRLSLAAGLPRYLEDIMGNFEDIIQAARDFGEKMKEMAPEMERFPFEHCHGDHPHHFFYPPTNIYSDRDGSMILEFALAGIEESAVTIVFQGDYLVLSAKASGRGGESDEGRFSRRGFKPRDIDRQKYRVPAEDYAQELAKAVFKNGVLTVTVPPKESEGIKIEIVKEGI